MFILKVSKTDLKVYQRVKLTSGASNSIEISFMHSEEWDSLHKTVVFKGSGHEVKIALFEGTCYVPWEVLQTVGSEVTIGVCGTKDDVVVLPTIYTSLGIVEQGAEVDNADFEQSPTSQVVEQLYIKAEHAEEIAQSVRDDADSGNFDGDDGLSAYEIAVLNGFVGTPKDWLESLKGPKGDSLKYEDLTEEQQKSLIGPKGDAFVYEDFTSEQLSELKGEPFTYDDFTEEQLNELKGSEGKSAYILAIEGGYTGTEEQFQQALANVSEKEIYWVTAELGGDDLTITSCDRTLTEILSAYNSGKYVVARVGAGDAYLVLYFCVVQYFSELSESYGAVAFIGYINDSAVFVFTIKNYGDGDKYTFEQEDKTIYGYALGAGFDGSEEQFKAKLVAEHYTKQESDNKYQLKGNYLTEHQSLADYAKKTEIPDVPNWAMQSTKPSYSASEVGAEPQGTADTKVSSHNTSNSAHNDIRLLIEGLIARLNALANSDDTTLDQMSEIVAYIKNNKSLIDGITTGKVSVSDIIDNLTTSVSNKPLSAKQGVVLKAAIDEIRTALNAISIPTKLSDLEADSTHRVVTDAEKQAWNAKSNFSGSYNDLTNKPSSMKNPNIIEFTGAVSGSYDGSEKKTFNIPTIAGEAGKKVIQLVTNVRTFTSAQWSNYGEIGNSENWINVENLASINVNDIGVLYGKNSNTSSDVILFGLVTNKAATNNSVVMTTIACIQGTKGANGNTPQKGIDYFTDADKQEIVTAVIDGLPKYNGEVTQL